MQIKIELPRDWEVSDLKIGDDGKTITMTPRFQKGTTTAPVAYVTAKGDSGKEQRSVITVSAKRGDFKATGISDDSEAVEFDQPADQPAAASAPPPKAAKT